jgi:hypothetical protein
MNKSQPLTAPLRYGGGSANINSMRIDRLVHLICQNAKLQNVSGHFKKTVTNPTYRWAGIDNTAKQH